MQRQFYNIFYSLLLPFILLRLICKSLKNKNYRKNLLKRFFFNQKCNDVIWVHAVSVGEIITSYNLITNLSKIYQKKILITCSTPTGLDQIDKTFKKEKVIKTYLPYDLPLFVKLFLKQTKPLMAIFIETEIWINYLYFCKKDNIPTFLINARLSEKSFQGYKKILPLISKTINNFSAIGAQTKSDKKRFLKLNYQNIIKITGSIKFDISIPEKIIQYSCKIKKKWHLAEKQVILAASTHENEEKVILEIYKKLQSDKTILIITPRHQERFNQVFDLIKNNGYIVARKSLDDVNQNTQVILGDSLGEMFFYYNLANIVFIGGSLIEKGGHNMIEPSLLKKPIIIGESYFNFQEIVDQMKIKKAIKISNNNDLKKDILLFMNNPKDANLFGQNAFEFIHSKKGALEKSIKIIEKTKG